MVGLLRSLVGSASRVWLVVACLCLSVCAGTILVGAASKASAFVQNEEVASLVATPQAGVDVAVPATIRDITRAERDTTFFWLAVWLGQFALVGVAIAFLLLENPRWFPAPAGARVLAGFAAAPLILGAVPLGLVMLDLGGPLLLFRFAPGALALVVLLARLRHWRKGLGTVGRRLSRSGWHVRVCVGILAILGLIMAAKCPDAIRLLRSDNDFLEYMSEGRDFARARTTEAIPEFFSNPDTTRISFMHSFVYQAYLGHAQTFSPGKDPGPPLDHAARLAFLMTIASLMAALAALAWSVGGPVAACLAFPCLLLFRDSSYVFNVFSRDGFRTVPFLLLLTLLVSIRPGLLLGRGRSGPLAVAVFVAAAATCAGHSLGILATVLTMTAWMAVIMLEMPWRPVRRLVGPVAVCAGSVLGFLFGSQSYVKSALFYGQVAECNVSLKSFFLDTGAWGAYLSSQAKWVHNTTSWSGRMTVLLERANLPLVALTGVICCVLLIQWRRARGRGCSWNALALLAVLAIANALPWLGAFDVLSAGIQDNLGLSLSQRFVKNARYIFSWYPFAAVIPAAALVLLLRKIVRVKFAAPVLAVLTCAGLVGAGAWHVQSSWNLSLDRLVRLRTDVGALHRAMSRNPGRALVCDDDRYSYYLDPKNTVPHVSYFGTRPTYPLIKAASEDDVWAAIRALNIGAFCFARWPSGIPETPLGRLLATAEHVETIPAGVLRVFVLRDPPSRSGEGAN